MESHSPPAPTRGADKARRVLTQPVSLSTAPERARNALRTGQRRACQPAVPR